MRSSSSKALFVVFAASVTLAWADEVRNPLGLDPAAAEAGKALYEKTGCVACHGSNARGAVGPDLTDDEWLRAPSDEMIFNTIRNGRAGTLMSPFKDMLTEQQVWQLVTYLRDENRKRHESGELR